MRTESWVKSPGALTLELDSAARVQAESLAAESAFPSPFSQLDSGKFSPFLLRSVG